MADATSTTFPVRTWGRPDTALARAGQRFVATRAGSWVVRTMVPFDRWLLVRSGGRFTALGPFGTPMLLLTTTGSHSGRPRTTPLVCLPDGDAVLVAGSNFGQQHHPAWSANLLAHPEATVAVGGQTIPVLARSLDGSARQRAWERFMAVGRPYRVYEGRTDRTIRVFSLSRRDDERG